MATGTVEQYANQLKDISGADVRVIAREGFSEFFIEDSAIAQSNSDSFHPKFLFIKTEDTAYLSATLKKSGLSEDDLPITFDSERGGIRISVEDIKQYDNKYGKGALFAKLASGKEPELTQKTAYEINFLSNFDGQKDQIAIKNGDFSVLKPEIINASFEEARKMLDFLKENESKIGSSDPAKIKQLAQAAAIDGDSTTLTKEELAAYLLAKSMAGDVFARGGEPIHLFKNNLPKEDLLGRNKHQDSNVTFQTARQIFGDAMKGKIEGGIDTTSPEGNKPYIEAVHGYLLLTNY